LKNIDRDQVERFENVIVEFQLVHVPIRQNKLQVEDNIKVHEQCSETDIKQQIDEKVVTIRIEGQIVHE
jgi:hypothetical protein